MKQLLATYELGDMSVDYMQEDGTGAVGLELVPTGMLGQRLVKQRSAVDPCIHLKLTGDRYPDGFSHGRTMRSSESVRRLVYTGQEVRATEEGCQVMTRFQDEERGLTAIHSLIWRRDCDALECRTVIENNGSRPVTLEMLTSFSMGGITPFAEGDGHGHLQLHRLRSTWSMEGRHEAVCVEDLQLEPSWQHYSANTLRFGQVGSMPVRGFFPWAAVEDTEAGATWAVQLACPGSWQLEVYRRDNGLCLSGGLADRELGHWLKELAPGETFEAPTAFVTVVCGGMEEAAERLLSVQELHLRREGLPEVEEALPVLFNEFCTTWGRPTAAAVKEIADRLEGRGIGYLIIDCGWYAEEGKNWWSSMGDWVPNKTYFPDGIGELADYIRSKGMVPGLWFEIESCGEDSAAFHLTDHLLKRDGFPLTVGMRRFWDLRDPWTVDYLRDRVTGLLRESGFGYLKIDYNDSIGIGCDGAESQGEGLRVHLEGVQSFLRQLRVELPELVIENCSSGGHRLEPSFMGLTSMSSFSDAHEELEIPIIAANLHRVMLPRQNQIWAVIRKQDSKARIRYSMVSAFLGRLCLSGDIAALSEDQWRLINDGIAFYQLAAPVIREGTTRRYGPPVFSYRHPEGWQAVLRTHRSGNSLLAVIHTFGGTLPDAIRIELPGPFAIIASYGEQENTAAVSDGALVVPAGRPFQATALLLERPDGLERRQSGSEPSPSEQGQI